MLFMLTFRLVPVQQGFKKVAWAYPEFKVQMCKEAMMFIRRALPGCIRLYFCEGSCANRNAAASLGPCWLCCDSHDKISSSHFHPNLNLISASTLVCTNTHYVTVDLDHKKFLLVPLIFPCCLSVTHRFSKWQNRSIFWASQKQESVGGNGCMAECACINICSSCKW